MTGLVAVVGGCEQQPGCERIDRRLLAESGLAHQTVAVLMAATVRRRIAAKIAETGTYWRGLGARVAFGFAGGQSGPEQALLALTAPGVVVLTGGRPWLLERRLSAPIVRRLRELHRDGVPIAGSSAGAMALATTRLDLEPGRAPRLLPGLGFVAGAAAPHYGRHGTATAARMIARSHPQLTILGLPDRTALIGRDDTFDVVGVRPCGIVRGRDRRWYPPGSTVQLRAPRRHVDAVRVIAAPGRPTVLAG